MKLLFVMGMSGVGKSAFIKENFPNLKKLDLIDFQNRIFGDNCCYVPINKVWQSYVELKEEILSQLEYGEDIVIEHTLLKRERREFYLEDLKNKGIDIVGYFLDIEKDLYLERNPDRPERHYDDAKEVQELPVIEEGFSEVHIVEQKK